MFVCRRNLPPLPPRLSCVLALAHDGIYSCFSCAFLAWCVSVSVCCRVFVRVRTALVLSPGISWWFFSSLIAARRSQSLVLAVCCRRRCCCRRCCLAVLCISMRLVGCWLVMSNLCCVTVVVVLFVELVITWPFLHDGQEVSAMKRLFFFFITAHVAKQEPGFISARLSNSRADGLTKRLLSCSPGLSIAAANI